MVYKIVIKLQIKKDKYDVRQKQEKTDTGDKDKEIVC